MFFFNFLRLATLQDIQGSIPPTVQQFCLDVDLGPFWRTRSPFCVEEDGFEDSKAGNSNTWRALVMNWRPFFWGVGCFFASAFIQFNRLQGRIILPNCHEIQHSGRQTSQASKFQSTVRWGWTLGKLLIFVELCWADKVGPNFPLIRLELCGPY